MTSTKLTRWARDSDITNSKDALAQHIGGAKFCGVPPFSKIVVVTHVGEISDTVELEVTIGDSSGTVCLRNIPATWQRIEEWHGEGIPVSHEHRFWEESRTQTWDWADSLIRRDRIKGGEIR